MKKFKFIKLFSIIICFSMILVAFTGCKACYRRQWQNVYNAYTNENDRFVFQRLNATIINSDVIDDEKILRCYLSIVKEDFCERYKEDPNVESSYYAYQRQSFYFVAENISILEETGFFKDISENAVITITVNNYIGWDGWRYPIFGVEMNGKTYLDFDTGYENVINYVNAQIKTYS